MLIYRFINKIMNFVSSQIDNKLFFYIIVNNIDLNIKLLRDNKVKLHTYIILYLQLFRDDLSTLK